LKTLKRSFYLRPALQVARDLLGKNIIRYVGKRKIIGKIIEVEAYRANDPAAHTFRGKTRRNEVMFGEGGHLYVYFTYGMHFCANAVAGPENKGEGVLIRAVEPLTGIELMMKNRYGINKTKILKSINNKQIINLTNGPAKFCQAFGIKGQENGLDLTKSRTVITEGEKIESKNIARSTRIGIRVGKEKKWRFFIKGNPWVSRK
jgi:DNA-3-methyladenine glycosylase